MRLESPRISVVIPAFEHERWVEAAIRSVLSQTLSDLELIVIDDASSDGTWAVVESIEDPRIRRSRHENNRGAHATLDEGVRLARAPLVTILNSDDVFDPGRLEALVRAFEDPRLMLLGTGVALIDAKGALLDDPKHGWNVWVATLEATLLRTGSISSTLCSGNLFLTTSNFVFRRTLYDELSGFSDLRYCHDYDFALRAVVLHPQGVRLDLEDRSLRYRLHGRNTISEDRLRPNLETFELLLRMMPALLSGPPEAATLFAENLRTVRGHADAAVVTTRTLEDALERERALNEGIRWVTSPRVSFRRWRKARREAP